MKQFESFINLLLAGFILDTYKLRFSNIFFAFSHSKYFTCSVCVCVRAGEGGGEVSSHLLFALKLLAYGFFYSYRMHGLPFYKRPCLMIRSYSTQ